MSDSDKIHNVNYLRWQCRRGMKEIEVVLGPFLESHYDQLPIEMKRAFVELLECEDVDLFEWFMTRNYPDEGPHYKILELIFRSVD